MADHLKPTNTSTYSNFVLELDARLDDLAVGLDPAATTVTNPPTNSIRWSSASNKWQKFNGTAWGDLSTLFSISISGNAATVTNGIYTTGTYADPAWLTSIAGTKVSGAISGNAGTATKLITARNINGIAFDGTTAISINLNTGISFNNTGSGAATGASFNGASALVVSYNTVGAPSTSGAGAYGEWGINITGNADTVNNGVYTFGNQTIAGEKTFTSPVYLAEAGFSFNSDGARDTGISWASDGVMNVRSNGVVVGQFNSTGFTGNASTVSNGVYTSGNQTLNGIKTFTNGIRFNDGTTQTTAGGSLFAASGWRRDPSGMIFQWGSVSLTSGQSLSLSFPIAFTTACQGVQTCVASSGDINEIVQAHSIVAGGFIIRNSNNQALTVSWLAYGY